MASAEKPTILLTFDVEDWFQVENFKAHISRSEWDRCDLRVWKNTLRILELLDRAPGAPRATFFILGWVAQKVPALVREIVSQGHEVASHGMGHSLCHRLSAQEMSRDLVYSKALLEDMTGRAVKGYRAPSFSITEQTLEAVQAAGYRYDASYNNFSVNDRYGCLDLDRAVKHRGCYEISPGFFEIPISNLSLGNQVLPLGGGGYFRLFPFSMFKRGMDQVLKKERTFVFYAHPWEFDPAQPKVHRAPLGFRFRHYINLKRTEKKLSTLIGYFQNCAFLTCQAYIDGAGHDRLY